MKEIKTTNKQKFAQALGMLEKASKLYDSAAKQLAELGIELTSTGRPIERFMCNPKKLNMHIYSGVEAIAEINGTQVVKGASYFAEGDDRYISTVVNGIDFHELVKL